MAGGRLPRGTDLNSSMQNSESLCDSWSPALSTILSKEEAPTCKIGAMGKTGAMGNAESRGSLSEALAMKGEL